MGIPQFAVDCKLAMISFSDCSHAIGAAPSEVGGGSGIARRVGLRRVVVPLDWSVLTRPSDAAQLAIYVKTEGHSPG